jgi:hypothetical protein
MISTMTFDDLVGHYELRGALSSAAEGGGSGPTGSMLQVGRHRGSAAPSPEGLAGVSTAT